MHSVANGDRGKTGRSLTGRVLGLLLVTLTSCSSQVFDVREVDGSLNSPVGLSILNQAGQPPLALVVNSNFDLSQTSGSISILELEAGTAGELVLGEVHTIANLGMDLRLEGEVLYLTQKDDHSLDLYRLHRTGARAITMTFDQRIFLDSNPGAFALHRSDEGKTTLAATNTLTGVLSVVTFEGAPPRVVELALDSTEGATFRFSRGIGLCTVAITPDGRFALAGSTNANIVFVVDLARPQVEGYVYLERNLGGSTAGVRGIAVDEARSLAYVSSLSQNRVLVLDLSMLEDNQVAHEPLTSMIIDEIPIPGTEPSTLALAPNGRSLYVLDYESSMMTVLDLVTRSVVKELDTGNGPMNLVFHEPSGRGYVTNFLSDSITVFDYEHNLPVGTIRNPH